MPPTAPPTAPSGQTPVTPPKWPELSFTEAEAEVVMATYAAASVILEYGSGGSTVLAAEMTGKLVISVESDMDWAMRMGAVLDEKPYPSQAILHRVDIGATGSWGRPVDDTAWRKFSDYPLSVWKAPYFRQPDVVLIDGRFRPACFGAVLLGAQKPVRVLFDDYVQRPAYHMVEAFAKPALIAGRMAVFDLLPGQLSPGQNQEVVKLFSQASLADQKNAYAVPGA